MYSRFVWSHNWPVDSYSRTLFTFTHTFTHAHSHSHTHTHIVFLYTPIYFFPSIPLVWSVSGLVGYNMGSSSPFHSFAPSGSLFTVFSFLFTFPLFYLLVLRRVASGVGRVHLPSFLRHQDDIGPVTPFLVSNPDHTRCLHPPFDTS